MSPPRAPRPRRAVQVIADLRLFWKLLIPSLIVILLVGTIGTFALVRNIADRAQASLDTSLTQLSLGARSLVHDRELSLLESANLAANVEGMPAAVADRDARRIATLLGSVLALKTDLTLVAVTDARGQGLSEFTRDHAGTSPIGEPPSDWTDLALTRPILVDGAGRATAGLVETRGRARMLLAVPVCAAQTTCQPAGIAIAGIDADALIADASERAEGGDEPFTPAIALFGAGGLRIAHAGGLTVDTVPSIERSDFVRKNGTISGRDVQTLYSPLVLQGQRVGSLAVTLPKPSRFSSVGGAALRVALLLLIAMTAIGGIGALVSRFVLRQVRAILDTNRKIAQGDLSARAPVYGEDEHGELAQGLNQMADALEESHRTLERKVEERTAELERLLQERTDFFAAVSHEFRTPLAVILGQAQLLSSKKVPKNDEWHAQAGQILTDAGNQLLTFVNDILEIAKAEAGRIEIVVADVRLGPMIESLEPTLSSLAQRNGLSLSVHRPKKLPVVRGDETRIKEVVLNLVDNAVKYTPPGGRVDVELAPNGRGATLSVTDTGIGIPVDDVERIFEPFYRVKGSETQSGQPSSGLGLALVKRLVDAQGGRIDVRSDPGEGSTFTVWLPGAPTRVAKSTRTPTRRGTL